MIPVPTICHMKSVELVKPIIWSPYVTGFWKTDRIVTLHLFHFIGPANGHTRTLHTHSAITRLGGLVCFSRASFADPVNSWLRQWDPWRALHGRHGSEIHPSDGETSLTPFQAYLGLWLALLGPIASPNNPYGRYYYKTLAKRLFQLYSTSDRLQSSTRELQWLEYLKSVFP